MLRVVPFVLLFAGTLSAAEIHFRFIDAKKEPVADAVVSLAPLDAAVPAFAPPAAVIAQQQQEFLPYVSAIRAGTAIDFPNRDTVKHHVYSSSRAKRFELPLYSGDAGEPVTFDQPGVVTLGCNIHDWMLAYVVVLETPWFAKTADDGAAAIPNVPPGRYRAEIWQPRLAKPVSRELTVAASAPGGPIEITLQLGRDRRIRRHVEPKAGGYK